MRVQWWVSVVVVAMAVGAAGPSWAQEPRERTAGDRVTNAEMLRRSLEFRRSFGLRRDLPYVKRLLNDEVGPFGVPLTDEEEARMRRRLRVQRRLDRIDAYAQRRAPRSYAGRYTGRQGLVHVLFAGPTGDHARSLRRLFRHPRLLRFRQVRFSKTTLDAVKRRVSAARDQLVDRGVPIVSVGVRYRANRVRVGVTTTPTRRMRALLRTRFGPSVRLFRSRVLESESRYGDTPPPLKGGLAITHSGWLCTSAFVARRRTGDLLGELFDYYMISAGHCGDDSGGPGGEIGDYWTTGFAGEYEVGSVRRNAFGDGSKTDGMITTLNTFDVSDLVYKIPYDVDISAVQDDGDEGEGDIVCMSGVTSGWRCGPITDTTDDVTFKDGVTLRDQNRADYVSDPGDSGAPVLTPSGLALGVHSGGAADPEGQHSCCAIYSHIEEVENALDVRVYTGD